VYTWFCLFEYVIVVSNMAFHSLACFEFNDKYLDVPVPVAPLALDMNIIKASGWLYRCVRHSISVSDFTFMEKRLCLSEKSGDSVARVI
jgi:hypothetical protein